MNKHLMMTAMIALLGGVAKAASDNAAAAVPEDQWMRTRPDVVKGRPVETLAFFRRAEEITTTGNFTYSNTQKNSDGFSEFGPLREWYEVNLPNREDPTGARRTAWVQAQPLVNKLASMGDSNALNELRAVRDANRNPKTGITPQVPASNTAQASSRSPWFPTRAPASYSPGTASPAAPKSVPVESAALSGVDSFSLGAAQSSGATGPGQTTSQAPALPGAPAALVAPTTKSEEPICAKSEADYKANQQLSRAFENSRTPFSQWNGPNNSILAPAKNGQWNITANGKVLRSLPLQICIPQGSQTPYFALFNTKFDLATDKGQGQILKLDKDNVFTQSVETRVTK